MNLPLLVGASGTAIMAVEVPTSATRAQEDVHPQKRKGLLPMGLPRVESLSRVVTGLLNLFPRDVFFADHAGSTILALIH